ncbi:DUF742 domain-containing protein [Streptomyces sp. GF20]|uniref:DUF742 domain-containing protein n=1 Tax=Streptomyces sp. GF20 TaxID=2692235 RepID=UPI0013167E39|nr:DUF742 domain-containing protein [Streptomyces sp. GF20]QHC18997.1 DUF742 domain-containing protein [Streptomyces sp. GF20]
MRTQGGSPADETFVRSYLLTGGRTRPRHVLGLATVLEVGPGRSGSGQPEECEQILALCRERRRSVTELAGRLGRPVPAVKILISDLLDADALVVPVTAAFATPGTDEAAGPTPQLLAALAAGLKRKWPDAIPCPQAG